MKKFFAFQVLIALFIGALIGHFFPGLGQSLRPIGDAFIHLIKMIVVPIVFTTIVIGSSGDGNMKKMGSLGLKTIIWFEFITTLILGIGLLLVNILKPGAGLNLSYLAQKDISQLNESVSKVVDFKTMLVNIIPSNIVDAMAKSDLLAVIFFAILFGAAAGAIGKASEPAMKFMESVANIMFKLTQMVMVTAPIGVLSLMAASVGQYGIALLIPMAKLIGVVYLGLAIVIFGLFPVIAWFLKISYFKVFRMVWDLFLIAFSTTSTETILPQLMDRMESYGCSKRVVSFVIPSGLSLNCDGSTLYLSVCSIFLAQAYGIPMDFGQQLIVMGVLVATSKGIAAVPSGSLVVLLATASAVGLPAEGVAIIAGIDRVLDMARTACNTPGHVLACIVVSKWEKEFRQEEWIKAQTEQSSIRQA
ncbi:MULTISPECIES: dicarboxylate/amino acid:cation symporter [unclassified Peribacillus]|uniref:dicarboxylate/amino acid:cation symporter n=1 Tax=unclassified Peribacillus TaxID=2675266 RepID=UPI0019141290|nr:MULTISPECIES: cation:dicarboxylase symporter family transporter [unclassified Peribacillus]MBK5459031.1 cation:dicarboxylase symporter family transporter [Peribacillus sp. TH27]MBK5480841.1 cation:dicarboxylase symporter family transporter [Peribacillus sp. TH16]MBK5502396.1 cation:dicarboxylase symporter family transporter [Peribacillus sp. TH14]WMX57683.1 cation:dicarboxylase symporter family transporter [Peribacillus sp. R9-11]